MESPFNKEVKVRGTHVDVHGLVHANKQWVKIGVFNIGLIHPLMVVTFDFQTNPYRVHVSHARQKGGDEV